MKRLPNLILYRGKEPWLHYGVLSRISKRDFHLLPFKQLYRRQKKRRRSECSNIRSREDACASPRFYLSQIPASEASMVERLTETIKSPTPESLDKGIGIIKQYSDHWAESNSAINKRKSSFRELNRLHYMYFLQCNLFCRRRRDELDNLSDRESKTKPFLCSSRDYVVSIFS